MPKSKYKNKDKKFKVIIGEAKLEKPEGKYEGKKMDKSSPEFINKVSKSGAKIRKVDPQAYRESRRAGRVSGPVLGASKSLMESVGDAVDKLNPFMKKKKKVKRGL